MSAGCSRTYEAFDTVLGEPVWIKAVPHSDHALPEAIGREYQSAREAGRS